jgi:hypothetical protein
MVVIAIIGILAGLILGGGGCSRSEGSRAGTITKFSERGVFTKSWEGELVMGGLRRGSKGEAHANIFQFTVVDQDVAKAIKAALRSGGPVELEYTQSLTYNPLVRDTSYTVLKVTPIVEGEQ